jgi:predicted MFS family arabinose efflux permease
VIFVAFRELPAEGQSEIKPFDWAGLILLTLAVSSLAYSANRVDTQRFIESLSSIEVWPFLLAAAILIPTFWRHEKRARDPIIRTDLFDTRQLSLAGLLAFSAGLTQPGFVFIPALAMASLGLKDQVASLMMLPMMVTMVVGSNVVGNLLDRHGSRKVITAGAIASVSGLALLIANSANLWIFALSCAVCGIGFSGLMGAPLSYLVISECPPEDRATSQGAISLYSSTGMLVGGALFGALVASRGGGAEGYQAAYIGIMVLILIMALFARGLKGKDE